MKGMKIQYNRILTLLAAVLLLQKLTAPAVFAQASDSTHFYFVQITDTHFGREDHLAVTDTIIGMINALPMKIECVVHTGDITANRLEDSSVVRAGRAIFGKLRVPVHYIPGNHDITRHALEATHEAYLDNFGALISEAEYEGVTFIFVYTEPLRRNFTVEGYDPLQELEARLQRLRGRPVIVFHHSPAVSDFYNNGMIEGWDPGARQKWIALLNEYRVEAVIAGHFHRDEFHWLGDIPLYVCPPVARNWGRQPAYRIYEYRNGKLGYRTQYLE